jgi:hypothetical protein
VDIIPGNAASILVESGQNQTSQVMQPILPFTIIVIDAYSNAVYNEQVMWEIVEAPQSSKYQNLTKAIGNTDHLGRVNTTLHFGTVVGSYVVRAYLSDPSDPSAADKETLLFSNSTHGPLHTILIDPAELNLGVNKTSGFSANGFDEYHNTVQLQPQWGTTIGNVNTATGLFYSGLAAGNGTVTVSSSGVAATALINIMPGPLASMSITPQNLTLVAEGSAELQVRGQDEFGNEIIVSPLLGTNMGEIDSTGNFKARAIAGTGIVAAVKEGISAEAMITILPDELVRIGILPGGISTPPQSTTQLRANGYDKHGNLVQIRPSWHTTTGTISANRVLTTGLEIGIWHVTARHEEVMGKIKVEVVDITRPEVTMHSPDILNNETEEDVDVVLIFSEALNKSSVAGNIEISPLVAFEHHWNGNTLLIFIRDMEMGTAYTMTLNANITDLSGNSLKPFLMKFYPGFRPGDHIEGDEHITASLGSGGHMLVTDAAGKRLGYFREGYIQELPDSAILTSGQSGHEVYRLYDLALAGTFTYTVTGTEKHGGHYSLIIELRTNWQTLTVAVDDIWIKEGQSHRFTVNWSKVELDTHDSVSIQLDVDGNSEFEISLFTNAAPSQAAINEACEAAEPSWLLYAPYLLVFLIFAVVIAASRRGRRRKKRIDYSRLQHVELTRVYCNFCGKEFSSSEQWSNFNCPLCGMNKGFNRI